MIIRWKITKLNKIILPLLLLIKDSYLCFNNNTFKNGKNMGKIGVTEIILILLVVVLLFGGRKIPELMKGIGQGMKEFKKASKVEDDTTDASPEKDKEAVKE
jgi:sec-independent protein translocase protein TatA